MKKDSRTRLFEVMSRLDKTFKPTLNEAEDFEAVEPQEHGSEGAMYKAKLEEIVKSAKRIYKTLPEEEIPAWVQDKIVLAKEKLADVCGWLHTEEEEEEGEELGANREMDDEEDHDEEMETSDDSEEEGEKEEEEESEKEEEVEEELSKPKAKVPVKNW